MTTALYIIWILIPLGFFLLLLWNTLEAASAKKKRSDLDDFQKTAFFVAGCSVVTFLIDTYILPQLQPIIESDWTPMPMFRILLFPTILYLGSLIVGPKKEIRIEKAPRPTANKRSKVSNKKK